MKIINDERWFEDKSLVGNGELFKDESNCRPLEVGADIFLLKLERTILNYESIRDPIECVDTLITRNHKSRRIIKKRRYSRGGEYQYIDRPYSNFKVRELRKVKI